MIKKLKDILNTYTDEELEEITLWANSDAEIEKIIIDDCSIDFITADKKINIDED